MNNLDFQPDGRVVVTSDTGQIVCLTLDDIKDISREFDIHRAIKDVQYYLGEKNETGDYDKSKWTDMTIRGIACQSVDDIRDHIGMKCDKRQIIENNIEHREVHF